MALYFAANRWGNGKGIYDYKAHADRLLRDMVHREPITGMVRQRGGLRQHTVGKEVNDEHGMILFSPDERNTLHRRLLPPARVLRAVGAVGAGGGPRVLGAGGGGQPRLLREERPTRRPASSRTSAQFDGTPLGLPRARVARRSARTPGASR